MTERFVWQRPQQVMSRLARERRVVFVEEAVQTDGAAAFELSPREEGVIVAVPHLPAGIPPERTSAEQARLLEELVDELALERYVLWVYTPMAIEVTRRLKPLAVVYDCMDELSAFAHAPERLREHEDELFERADLVFTGGASLYAAKRDRHLDVHLFPSSVDTAHFAAARAKIQEPADQRSIPRPRLGYMGVIDERMHLDLVAEIAAAEQAWQIVLLGTLAKIDPAELPQAPNIHYLGQRPYEQLPAYLQGWDVGLMPFARNDSTRFISPTKTPEYLAAGLPVVSTPITDVVRPYGEGGLVRIAEGVEQFVQCCRDALLEDSDDRLRRVDAFLTESSWDFTSADMNEHLERVVRGLTTRRSDAPRHAPPRRERFDCLVVGAGFAGSVVAERLAADLVVPAPLGPDLSVFDRHRTILSPLRYPGGKRRVGPYVAARVAYVGHVRACSRAAQPRPPGRSPRPSPCLTARAAPGPSTAWSLGRSTRCRRGKPPMQPPAEQRIAGSPRRCAR